MALLEEHKLLDRASEDLPTSEEIGERRRAGRGMERPELAIAASPTPSGCWRARWRRRTSSTSRGSSATCATTSRPRSSSASAHLLAEHPLRRAADLHGQRQRGRQRARADVRLAAAWPSAAPSRPTSCAPSGSPARSPAPTRAGRSSSASRASTGRAQLELMGGVDALVEATTRWYLTWEPEGDIEETIAAGRDGFERLAARARRARLRRAPRAAASRPSSGWSAPACPSRWRAPTRCARSCATRRTWSWVAGATGRPIEEVAEVFFAVGAELRLDWIESASSSASRATTRMQRWALQAVREDAAQVRRELAGGVLAEAADGAAPSGARGLPGRARATRGRRLEAFLRSLSREGEPDLAGLTLAVRQLRTIVE